MESQANTEIHSLQSNLLYSANVYSVLPQFFLKLALLFQHNERHILTINCKFGIPKRLMRV
jgi:hypothetical protein